MLIYQLLEKTPYIRLNTALSASLSIIRKTPYIRLNTAFSASLSIIRKNTLH